MQRGPRLAAAAFVALAVMALLAFAMLAPESKSGVSKNGEIASATVSIVLGIVAGTLTNELLIRAA